MDTLYIFINDKYLVSSVLKGILFSEAEPDWNILFFFKYNHHHLTIEKQFRIKMAAMIFVCTSVMEYVIIHWFFSLEEKSLNEGRFVYFYKRQQCCNPHHLSSVATRSVLLNAINIIHIISVKSFRSRQSVVIYQAKLGFGTEPDIGYLVMIELTTYDLQVRLTEYYRKESNNLVLAQAIN